MKKHVTIPKDFFKKCKFKVSIPTHKLSPKCACLRCIERRNAEMRFIESVLDKEDIIKGKQ